MGVKKAAKRSLNDSKKSKSSKRQRVEKPANKVEESEDELDESEDELDESEEDELDQDDEVGEDADEAGEADENSEDAAKASREEQKKLLQERKLQRKSGVEVEQIKKLWEKLRVRNPPVPKEVRKKLVDETWKLCNGVIGDLVLKHDASRVVQTLVKFSSKERRSEIVKELEPYFYQLATSAYGKYLLIKLLKYGSKEDRKRIINSLHGKYRKLLRHREGAYVLEDMFVLYATAKQREQMLKEFWGSEYAFFAGAQDGKDIKQVCEESAEKKKIITSNLAGTIKASVEKGSAGFEVLHAVMKQFMEIAEGEELRELEDSLKDQIAEMVHTSEGAEVASKLIARATAKERKAIVKGLKQHAQAMAKNEFGYNVLQTIFMAVDDTKLVGKTFATAFEDMVPVLTHKYGRRPFLYLLNGLDKSYFSPKTLDEIEKYEQLSTETSKKPQDKRREELLEAFLPVFYETLENKPYDLLKENMGSQFVQELVLNEELPEVAAPLRAKALDQIIDAVRGDLSKEDHLMHSAYTERLLKSLIQGGKWNHKEKKVVPAEGVVGLGYEFAKKFASELFDLGEDEDTLKSWIEDNAGAFVLVGLVDCFKLHKKEAEAKTFLKNLKKQKKFIAKQDTKGANLLAKVLE